MSLDLFPPPALALAVDAFSAYLPTANQSISNGVFTKVALSAESFDYNGKFDTTNNRWTPEAGLMQINWSVYLMATGTSLTDAETRLYKNGTVVNSGSLYYGPAISQIISTGSALVQANGTDYFELWAYIAGTSPQVGYGTYATQMSGFVARRG